MTWGTISQTLVNHETIDFLCAFIFSSDIHLLILADHFRDLTTLRTQHSFWFWRYPIQTLAIARFGMCSAHSKCKLLLEDWTTVLKRVAGKLSFVDGFSYLDNYLMRNDTRNWRWVGICTELKRDTLDLSTCRRRGISLKLRDCVLCRSALISATGFGGKELFVMKTFVPRRTSTTDTPAISLKMDGVTAWATYTLCMFLRLRKTRGRLGTLGYISPFASLTPTSWRPSKTVPITSSMTRLNKNGEMEHLSNTGSRSEWISWATVYLFLTMHCPQQVHELIWHLSGEEHWIALFSRPNEMSIKSRKSSVRGTIRVTAEG